MAWTVADIKAKFPNPITSKEWGRVNEDGVHAQCYCVGGALRAFIQPSNLTANKFPSLASLATAIWRCSNISSAKAYEIATEIIRLNDAGDFEGAWEVVERVQEHQREC